MLGLVAQLGERCVRNAEVMGSNPTRSTNDISKNRTYGYGRDFLIAAVEFAIRPICTALCFAAKKGTPDVKGLTPKNKNKKALTIANAFLELVIRIELMTSSLPMTCSTD